MSEDYNSPQSVYWCFKTMIALSLNEEDAFWQAKEEPYPSAESGVALVPTPNQILCNHRAGNHHFLLSPIQFVAWPMKATQAKYCKFAYSSAFPFSVPTGPLIQQIAPDNTLAFSRDGAETWAVRWKWSSTAKYSTFTVAGTDGAAMEQGTAASVRWYPWGDRAVQVDTTLVPPTDTWPDWHVRVHRIRINQPIATLHTVEGGFAGPGRRSTDGANLVPAGQPNSSWKLGSTQEVVLGKEGSPSVLILSYAGASGVAVEVPSQRLKVAAACSSLKPDSNTSLAYQRSLIPVATHDIVGGLTEGTEIVLVTKVFAISVAANGGDRHLCQDADVRQRWLDSPSVAFGDIPAEGSPGKARGRPCIVLPPSVV